MNQKANPAAPVPQEPAPDLADAPAPSGPADAPSPSPDPYTVAGVRFAHRAEAEFAQLLEFYQIEWRYEPDEFPLEWQDGRVTRQFRPDFYLPEYDLYIELTVMKQSLVRRKNRKLRRMRELYPMVRIKLLYARDFRALMLKSGRLDVAASLIGADGQVVPGGPLAGPDGTTADVARSSPVGEPADTVPVA
jgi:hypoxanthine phosphoribosyltransferase